MREDAALGDDADGDGEQRRQEDPDAQTQHSAPALPALRSGGLTFPSNRRRWPETLANAESFAPLVISRTSPEDMTNRTFTRISL